ncbi:MAG: pentapeptide repeat-containing protein [Okeania sp. SIO3B3]|nr:pentapeptide repeat-containing protein [Okeania sp. SIO3B3]
MIAESFFLFSLFFHRIVTGVQPCALFSGANLMRADLIDAYLSFADLSFADFSGADLSNIKWNNQTKWSNTINLHEAIGVPEDLQQNPEFATAVAQSEAVSQQQE